LIPHFGPRDVRSGESHDAIPGCPRAVDHLDDADSGVERVVVLSLAAEVMDEELRVGSLDGVIETPIEAVQVEVDVGRLRRELPHIARGVPRPRVTDVLRVDDRLAKVVPAAASLRA